MNTETRSNNKGEQGGIAISNLPYAAQPLNTAVRIDAVGDPKLPPFKSD